jgi:hypothetical protein
MSRFTRAFTDPTRRPRTIIVISTVVIGALALYGLSMILTSTQWFCNDACHNVHADNKLQFYASAHSQISCMACHYPTNMHPAKFALDRADKLLDVYPTFVGDFPMPLNEYSRIALKMDSSTCTQCHTPKRKITTSPGIIIDHEVHAKRGFNCTVCHNRTAHALTTPLSLPNNRYPEDFMTMRACYRCHALGADSPAPKYQAPGTCSLCHKAGYELKPKSHDASWVTTGVVAPTTSTTKPTPSGHAKAAEEVSATVAESKAEWAKVREEFLSEQPRFLMRLINVDTETPIDLPPAESVDECGMCHDSKTFCDACHAQYKNAFGN